MAGCYGSNGNQAGRTHGKNGTRRNITWDDVHGWTSVAGGRTPGATVENRIQKIKDNGHRLTYTYDASGQRITKRGPQGETAYINQWFTLRNGEVGTKHVFAGTSRVVSKLVKQDKPNSKRKGKIVYEKDQYYYHPDHLGTTAYITHTNGQVYQHLEYFPFGETWVEEHSNKQRTPYLFTAKELDEETGLYYFGARYYDPRTSVWQSVDPMLSAYIGTKPKALPGQGGIYEARNIGVYSYSFNSPIVLFDPDGNEIQYANHEVALGASHSKVVVIPDNQAAWETHKYAKRDSRSGKVFFTIGGGPDSAEGLRGPLLGGFNRARDVEKFLNGEDVDVISLDIPKEHGTEDSEIQSLIEATESYKSQKDKPPYALFPDGEEHNSNSFISGLLKATGFDVPSEGAPIHGSRTCPAECVGNKRERRNSRGLITESVPGYDHPVPEKYYEE